MRQFALLLALLFFPPTGAQAEIYKLAIPSDQGFSLYWWPMVPIPPGWHHDEEASRKQGANILVPDGQQFNTAPAIIYAKADYKPRAANVKTLAQFVANDIALFQKDDPGVRIRALEPLRDGDGQVLPCYSFVSKNSNGWEIVAYGMEDNYYLIFTVSAFNDTTLTAEQPIFAKLVEEYKK